ncbi:MAG: hypothetical protein VCA73_13750 [Roseibacillus sp.]
MSESEPSPPRDSPSSPPAKEQDPDSARNPGAGCIIMIVALLSLGFLVSFGVWNLFKLDRELSKFTEPDARPTPVPDLEANAAAINVLNSKIETFKTDQGNKRDASITLTPEEINLAIAAFAQFGELRKTFSVKSITKDQIHIDISFPLRGSPTKGDFRYLNGTMIATPELAGGEIILIVDRVDVPGKTVPDGFLGQLSPYRVTERYLKEEPLGPWMKKLTGLSLAEGTLTLTIKTESEPPGAQPKKVEAGHLIRAGVLLGAVLLGLIAVAILASKRGKQVN